MYRRPVANSQAAAPATAAPAAGSGNVKAVRAQLELAEQDCARISSSDYIMPFSSLENAVDRLLPFHVFGAEDPQQADVREVEAQAGAARLATARGEAWQDCAMHKVNEYGAGLSLLDKRIHKAEQEALQRSQLPLLMLQSYATAEAQAMMFSEQQRPQQAAAERTAQVQQAAAAAAAAEQQRQQAMLAQQQMRQQMQQQALLAQQQQQMLVQQQQMQQQAAAQQRQQQQAAQHAAGGMQQLRAPQQAFATASIAPGQQVLGATGAAGPPAVHFPPQHVQKQPEERGLGSLSSAADAKAKQLAALKARINQRK